MSSGFRPEAPTAHSAGRDGKKCEPASPVNPFKGLQDEWLALELLRMKFARVVGAAVAKTSADKSPTGRKTSARSNVGTPSK